MDIYTAFNKLTMAGVPTSSYIPNNQHIKVNVNSLHTLRNKFVNNQLAGVQYGQAQHVRRRGHKFPYTDLKDGGAEHLFVNQILHCCKENTDINTRYWEMREDILLNGIKSSVPLNAG